jgi:hypothetical protein
MNRVSQRSMLITIDIQISDQHIKVRHLPQFLILNHILTQDAFCLRNGPRRLYCFDIINLCHAH